MDYGQHVNAIRNVPLGAYMSVAMSMICIHTVNLNLDLSSMIFLYSVSGLGTVFLIQSFLVLLGTLVVEYSTYCILE